MGARGSRGMKVMVVVEKNVLRRGSSEDNGLTRSCGSVYVVSDSGDDCRTRFSGWFQDFPYPPYYITLKSIHFSVHL